VIAEGLAWLERIADILPLIGVVMAAVIVVLFLVILVRRIVNMRWLLKRRIVTLELTPPASASKSPLATQQLLTVLHGLHGSRNFIEKLLGRTINFSFELVANRKQGIRYLVKATENEIAAVEQNIAAYLPDVQFKRIEDTAPEQENTSILIFKQTGHFAYPLQAHESPESHDPLAYVTGTMTKLAEGDQMTIQLVVSPVQVREASTLSKHLLNNEELLLQLGKRKAKGFGFILGGISSLLFGVLDAIGEMTTPTKGYTQSSDIQHRQQVASKIKPARTLSTLEQQLANSVHNKLSQPIFKTDIRVELNVANAQDKKRRQKNIQSAFNAYVTPGHQSLKAQRSFLAASKIALRKFAFKHRLPSFFAKSSSLLSASELASLYHFPDQASSQTENVVTSLSKTLPAPVSLKSGKKLDILLALNHHHGEATPIGLTTAERERHIFIVGGTGNGKTTLLEYGLVQDIRNGKGIAVVDPHGDMAFKLLKYVPESRINDVVYFNPDDLSYPIGLNMLELPPDLTGDDLLRAKDLVTESVVSVFRKIFSDDDSGGHRIEYVLRNAIHTALTVEDCTLFTIYDLLNDPDYRKKVVSKLKDKNLVNFWKHEMGKAGGMQQVKMMAGITSKIGRFLFSASAKRILEQPKSTINFDDILNGKILICNFSKGLIGDDTSELFGIAILAKLQLAALRRARIAQSERKPFYLYVDEFQNFATDSFVQMLSEARKYKLFLTMAEQSTSQQDDPKIVDTIFANAGTLICFRSGSPTDEKYFLPRLKPVAEGEIAALPSYNFYMRIAAVESQEAFSGETIVLGDEGDEDMRERVIVASQKNYAKEYVEPEEEVAESSPIQSASATKTKKPKTAAKQKASAKKAKATDKPAKPLIPKKNKLS
jgi:hypothetical protein